MSLPFVPPPIEPAVEEGFYTDAEWAAQGTDEIRCPWCGYECGDSWAFDESGDHACEKCERAFFYQREISVSYSSSRLEVHGCALPPESTP